MKLKTVKKCAMIVSANAGLLITLLVPTLSFIPNGVEAATTSMGQLVAGDNHASSSTTTYGPSDLTVASNWIMGSSGVFGYMPNWAGNWLNMNNAIAAEATSATFKYALDMKKTVSYSGTFKADTLSGDYIGILFSPVSASKISTGAGGLRLAVGGLPNSVFMGRDLFYNDAFSVNWAIGETNVDNNLGAYTNLIPLANGSTQFRIETTNSSGLLGPSGSTFNVVNPISKVNTNSAGDPFTVNWSPVTINSDGTVTGNLKFSLGSGGDYVIYNNYIMQPKMSMALVASSALLGNYGPKSFSFNSASLIATKATMPVTVNYINKRTGQAMKMVGQTTSASPSTITGNIGDSIGVIAPGTTPNDTNTFDYSAPVFSGYTYDSSTPTIIANDTSNTINVYYTPVQEEAVFTSYYASGTPGTSITTTIGGVAFSAPSSAPSTAGLASPLPNIQKVTGYYGEFVSSPTLVVPLGYKVTKVLGPNGVSYNSVQEAVAANSLQLSTSTVNPNQFTIVYEALPQTAATHYSFSSIPPGTTSPTVADTKFSQGQTGSYISQQDIQTVIDQYKAFVSVHPEWKIESLTDPNGVITTLSTIDDLKTIFSKNGGAVLLSNSNLYQLKLVYSGNLSLISQSIDFNSHPVSGSNLPFEVAFPNNVTVTDTRTNPVPWKLTVEQTVPLHPVGAIITGKDYNNILSFGTSQTSRSPLAQKDGMPIPVEVYSQTVAKQGMVDVSSSLVGSKKFYLSMPAENQKLGQYEGTVVWTISNTP